MLVLVFTGLRLTLLSFNHDRIKSSWETTYHFEVLCSALGAVKVAGEQHVTDVVTGAVIEFPHVEWSRLEIMEISFHF